MTSCLPKSKHVKLTQACYPKSKTAPARPNQSELQYLTYYAASRPKKLIKVGSYLRQRTLKDAYWKRQTEMIVSLDICDALVKKCQTNLNLFAADFSTFCKYHDGTAYDTTTTYTESSHTLLRSYSRLAQGSAPLNLFGSQALLYTCITPTMHGANQTVHTPLVLSTALHNLAAVKPENLYQLRSQIEQHKDPFVLVLNETSGSGDQSIAEDVAAVGLQELPQRTLLEACSLNMIKHIFISNDSTKIRRATNKILQQADNPESLDSTWSSTLVKIAAEWVPINLRFHVLEACLEYLNGFEILDATDLASKRQSEALNIIYMLLTSKVSLIGLSTNDVMESLLNVAQKLPASFDVAFRSLGSSSDLDATVPDLSPNKDEIMHLKQLLRTMVAITSHSYYKNQVSDMFKFLLERACAAESTGNLLAEDFQGFHLDVAGQLLQASKRQSGSRVQPSSLLPGLVLLQSSVYVRRKFAHVLYMYLQIACSPILIPTTANSKSHDSSAVYNHDRNHEQDHEIGRLLRNSMYHYLKDPGNNIQDFNLGFDIVTSLHRLLPMSEMVILIPFLYRLQRESSHHNSKDNTSASIWRSRLEDAFYCVMHQCSASFERSFSKESSYNTLPELSTVTNHLRSSLRNELSDSQLLAISEEWSPEDTDRHTSRAVSVRNSQRNRLTSSASASREHFDLGSGTIFAGRPATGRISVLKQTLASHDVGSSGPTPALGRNDWTQSASLDMLFKDIDMKQLDIVAPDKPTMNPHDTNSQLSTESYPGTVFHTSQTSSKLGRIVA
ncbi:protein of unknown function [Taphrina deformans PYCC 5710]|uniref:Protein EFR3 n=1 Tax=Taphrina deformans (strain PYCC 5710 / ATCC 11124 / CBS 356.35 / IMI 108563 / JCM 9778 / NBRC 8474) TaxID=1097556 RepID=R4XLB3_TAPDE|nr:protein of unknown function [Taphrina deformans PYCC 5710]|eukprot:CCG84099.1 protein of unknown function [Taphrina deformans PYCC 5710]